MNLETKLNIEKDSLTKQKNIATLLSATDLENLGTTLIHEFENDLQSRDEWEKRMEGAMKLALQIVEQKSFPWPGASNVKFPLLTIAALQYHARAYPSLITGNTPVKCRVYGEDKDGAKLQRAERIEEHMSYQILEEDEDWESETDKVLITQPIIGCAFKKTYFSETKRMNISENILARDLVVNYWTKSLDTAPRVSQILYMQKNDVYERVARGLWLPLNNDKVDAPENSALSLSKDQAQGVLPPEPTDSSTPYEFIEQHCYIDLDQDGYAEPYIVWIRRDTKQIVRILARYLSTSIEYSENKQTPNKVLSIKGEKYFTKYPFIPSPDGGFYDLGFGVLLGPLNASIDTAINQLIDAGTMSTTAGGFLSKGVRIRGGNYAFSPLEWKHVESTGDDLRKGIYPLPVRDPSQTLFTLLQLLINYGERIGMSVDIMVGENPGQNTPAETSRTMVEQGSKIFNGIFKRTYRSLKDEFRKLYRLNQLHLEDNVEYQEGGMISWEDYQGPATDICPSADPNVVSDSQRLMQAQTVYNAAMQSPAMFDIYRVKLDYLKALKVADIDLILPDPKGPNAIPMPPDPKIQLEQIKQQGKQASDALNFKLGLLKLIKEAELQQAQIVELNSKAELEKAQAEGVVTGHAIAAIEAQIGAANAHRDGILRSIEVMSKMYEAMKPEETGGNQSDTGGI